MSYAPARRAALPAVLLTGLFVALLVVMLQSREPILVPLAVHVGLATAYIIMALLTTGAHPVRTVAVLLTMLATQAAMALLIALVYVATAVGGADMALPAAWIYSLTGDLTGLLLQAAVVFLMAPVAGAWWGVQSQQQTLQSMSGLAPIQDGPSFQQALDALCKQSPVAGVAVCRGRKSLGAGIWRADPKAACERAGAILEPTEKRRLFIPLGQAGLWVDSHQDRVIAIILDDPTTEKQARALGARLHAAVARVMEPQR
ncbi:MAG: hypothetical protein GX358_06760 [candidate division WS1 bacterium]|nr:hypothetical protein [candidate division WS1 bacterium]